MKISNRMFWRFLMLVLLVTVAAPVMSADDLNTHVLQWPRDDAGRAAAMDSAPLFLGVSIPGFTDYEADIGGLAAADLNRDGLADLFVVYDDGTLRMLLNQGDFSFKEHTFEIVDSAYTVDNPPGQGAIPNLVDFNEDGFLDIFITHNELMPIKQSSEDPSLGNSLLLSCGRFDRFVDRGVEMGVANQGAYNRQSSIGDVNGDGWLDIAIGADMIGRPEFGGEPVQRLYIYHPPREGDVFEKGKFVDIGGADAVPGFGGAYQCDPDLDKSSPGILLRDMDGDGDLDLVQGYANDMLMASQRRHECVSGENQFGIYAWINVTEDPAEPRFERVSGPEVNMFGGAGKMKYNPRTRDYEVISHGLGLKYITAFDAFNTGRLDLLAIGPTDPEFHVQSDMIAAAFFENTGPGLNYRNATDQVGLESMNWIYAQWAEFFECQLNPTFFPRTICALQSNRKRQCMTMSLGDHQPYWSTATFGDFNNDGFLDVVVTDRHEDPCNEENLRNIFFLNNGDGTFRPIHTELSGLDTNTVSAEVVDINNDGLLDLVCGVQPTNTYPLPYPPLSADRKRPKVYLNSGALGGRNNNWAQIILTGLPERQLVGAQLYAHEKENGRLLGRRDYFTNDGYKSGHELMVHWGFGALEKVSLRVLLPDGRSVVFPDVRRNERAFYNVTLKEMNTYRSR